MAEITYRKTGKGEWVAFGPAADLQAAAANGAWITITKRDGRTDRAALARVGRSFTAGGAEMAYGYISTTQRGSAPAAASSCTASRRSGQPMCDECGERRAVTTARDLSGIEGDVCGVCARSGALSFA